MSIQDDFIQQHAQNGELTAEQAAQLLELGEGDTGAASAALETGSEPGAATATEAKQAGEQAEGDVSNTRDAELNADNAVILARDGKHTIDFEVLAKSREGEKHWKGQAVAKDQEIENLRAQLQARQEAGDTGTAAQNAAIAEAAIEAGAAPEVFGDWSEEALAKGVQQVARQEAAAIVREELAKALQPFQEKQQVDAKAAHFSAIYEKHPDLDSVLDSKELEGWLAAQPSFVRTAFETVLAGGSAPEVVELIDTYKAVTGKGQAADTPAPRDVKAAAQAAIAKAQPAVPNSLSDFPGGRAGPASAFEAIANLPPHEQIDAVAQFSAEQRERWLNSQL